MALNTSVQPFIQKMLMPADADGAGEALVGAFRNFAGAYVAAKEGKRAQQSQKVNNPQSYDEAVDGASNPPDKPGRFENFAKAYLGAQGQVAMGANPALRPQVELLNQRVREGLLEERTLNQITSQDPMRVAEEAGNLTPSQVPQWLQKNAALRAVPWGQKIWDGVAAAYGDSEQAKISSAKAQIVGKLSVKYPNLDYSNPADRSRMMRNESVEELYARAAKQGKLLNALPDDWFFDDGTINDQKAVPGLGALPRSETLQSREELAGERMQSQMDIAVAKIKAQSDMMDFKIKHGAGFTIGALEKDINFIDKLDGYTAEEKKKIKDTRMFLEGKPGVEKSTPSKQEYVSGKINSFMMGKPTKEVKKTGWMGGSSTEFLTRKEAVKQLEEEYDSLYSGGASGQKLQPLPGGGFRYVPK